MNFHRIKNLLVLFIVFILGAITSCFFIINECNQVAKESGFYSIETILYQTIEVYEKSNLADVSKVELTGFIFEKLNMYSKELDGQYMLIMRSTASEKVKQEFTERYKMLKQRMIKGRSELPPEA